MYNAFINHGYNYCSFNFFICLFIRFLYSIGGTIMHLGAVFLLLFLVFFGQLRHLGKIITHKALYIWNKYY